MRGPKFTKNPGRAPKKSTNFITQQMPGDYVFGVFSKTVILSKSCSRCGGSTVLEGQTLQKSIRRATPNGTGEKNRQKSLPAPSPDALFRSRARFWSIWGVRPGAENRQKLVFSRPGLAPGAQLFAGLAENACRRPSERKT